MQVKFKDGTIKNCSNPTEQKIFRSGAATGWLCSFQISEVMTSTDVDAVLTDDNISELTFCNEKAEELFAISGYTKVTSAVVRHAEKDGTVEIQLIKGI